MNNRNRSKLEYMREKYGCLFTYIKFVVASIISYWMAQYIKGDSLINIDSGCLYLLPILLIPLTAMVFVMWITYWVVLMGIALLFKKANESMLGMIAYIVSILLMISALCFNGSYEYDYVDYMMDKAR